MSDDAGVAESGTVRATIEVGDGHTVVDVTGQRNAALVVRSESGERIYLPPEETETDGESPYRPGGESPYEGVTPDETPYGSRRRHDPSVGMNPTADGFQVVHPEPVTDVRLLR